MAEQDDASTLDNMMLAIQQSMLGTYKIRTGKVLSWKEIGPNRSPVVDIQIATKLVARPQDGDRSDAFDMAEIGNVPVLYFQGGGFTMGARLRKGDYVLVLFADREVSTWMLGTGATYVPALPGLSHEPTYAMALPYCMPEIEAPLLKPKDREFVIGDNTGQKCVIKFDSTAGGIEITGLADVTVKGANVTVEAGAIAKIKANTIQLETPGLFGGPYFLLGINAVGLGNFTGSNGGGPVAWVPTPGAGATTAVLP